MTLSEEGNADRPAIIEVGSLGVEDGVLYVDGWAVEDLTRPTGYRFPKWDWNNLFGRSVKELHDLAHATDCRCPIYGFTPKDRTTTLAYDSPAPYTWAT
jgi:hypothetical protein